MPTMPMWSSPETVASSKHVLSLTTLNQKKEPMKGFFKLTTAALALVALASCNNDDLFENGKNAGGLSENALQVEVEEMIDGITTRAAFVPNGTANQIFWQDGDAIKVFDEAMLRYDDYEFSEKRATFENNDADKVKTPAYALTTDAFCYYSHNDWDATDVDKLYVYYDVLEASSSSMGTEADANWDEDEDIASTKGNKVKAYESSIPMFGTAASEDGKVKVSMRYLTGVLRVQMDQLPSTVNDIRIVGWKDQACTIPASMVGTFRATVSDDDEVITDAYLEEIAGNNYNNVIHVDISGAVRSEGTYIYFPLIAQAYGALQVYYSEDGGTTYKLYKKTKPFTVERAKVYRLNIAEFEIAGADAESVNFLLNQKKEQTGPVVVKTTSPTVLKDDDYVFQIPAGMKAENLTFDLSGIDGSGMTASKLEIESEDGKFAGDVVIDLGDGTVTSLDNLYLNLPKSNVIIKGNFGTTNLGLYEGTPTLKGEDKLIVKSLKTAAISEDEEARGFAATQIGSISPNYESFEGAEIGIEVGANTTVGSLLMERVFDNKVINATGIKIEGTASNVWAQVKEPIYNKYIAVPVTVGDKATVNQIHAASDITIGEKATVASIDEKEGDITINGEATVSGAVAAAKGDITISEKATIGGNISASEDNKIAISTEKAIAGTVDGGEVALSGKASVTGAIGGTTAPSSFSIAGAAKAATVTVDGEGTAEINLDAEGEAITTKLTLGDKAALTLTQGYIAQIDGGTADAATLTFAEGEGFTAIAGINNKLDIKNASVWNGKKIGDDFKAKYATAYPVTACQFATADFTAAVTLVNSIDLNNLAWTPVELKAAFNGNKKTIKNLSVTVADDKGAGLFKQITLSGAALAVNDLTIDGAAISAGTKSNAAVLAGILTGNGELDATGVVIKNATVAGKYNLGGLVGDAQSSVVASKCDVNGVTFTVDTPNNDPKADESDAKAGSVGQYVGKAAWAVIVDKAATSAINRATMGFKANFKIDGAGKVYYYYPGTTDVGLFANTTNAKYKVGDAAAITATLDTQSAVAAGKVGYYLEKSKY